ncbi:MAG: BMP family ABC transporter substrate-binding protein [Anaerofustis stercorihominis]|nr:BMP family ABC transporter substrate-binding protein [Anaerofustis stercorihominis]
MKKLIAMLLAAMMIFSFAACGDDADAGADFKVGVIHIGNPADGSGYSFAHDQGIVAMQKNLNLKDEQIIRKNMIDDTNAAATKTAIEECIEEGCNIIFGTSWGYMETMAQLAEQYPDVIFSHGTGYMSNDKNFNNYFGRIYQARYLAGIAAGLKTQTDKIGYVAAMDISNSEVTGGLDAFAMGVQAVNPDAKVYVKVTNTWFSVDLEGQAATALLDLGCDVIAQHCDTTAPQLAAEQAGVWGCGYNSDMTPDAPKAHLTAPIWNWGVYYTAATQAAMDGKWAEFGNYFGGMKEGFVDISPLSENCAEGTSAKIEEARQLIIGGQYDVFQGAYINDAGEVINKDILDNQGNVVIKAGEKLEDATITGGINWYFENVILQ